MTTIFFQIPGRPQLEIPLEEALTVVSGGVPEGTLIWWPGLAQWVGPDALERHSDRCASESERAG